MLGLIPKTGFRHFRSRLIVFLLILLLPILGGIYAFVTRNNHSYTEQTINSYLKSGAEVFDFTLEQQSRTLLSILSSLTWDFGFRTAFGSADAATLYGASLNVLDRSLGGVETLMVVDMNGKVIIDTSLQGFDKLSGSWKQLLKDADSHPEGIGEAILNIADVPHRLIAVPLFLPRQVAWVIGGYPLNQAVLNRVKLNTLSDVSLIRVGNAGNQVVTSTLPFTYWSALEGHYDPAASSNYLQRIDLAGEMYGSLSRILAEDAYTGDRLIALVHRSYQENIVIERRFEQILAQFYLFIIAISIAAVMLLARSVTRPVQKLADIVRRIESGDYNASAQIRTMDEFGQLADSVNSMARGLLEKEKVRDLLGKVVSRQIADRLLKNPVDLEGEEIVTTIMYVDIKGFTRYCEHKNPREVLKVLNRYLGSVARQVESHNGVVDKFMGDGVMALYGAPVRHQDDVENALHTALRIKDEWQKVTDDSGGRDSADSLVPCIGIHTGLVVAGNLGSRNRMNYSVIGDAVNLAARLESLTRYYGVTCIVSAETAGESDEFLFRELDLVRVFGRRDPVRIFELIGERGSITQPQFEEIRQFQSFLMSYRCCRWDEAEKILQNQSINCTYEKLYSLYRERIAYFRNTPPGPDWQGVYIFKTK